jgi:aconitate hydratase
MGVLPLQFMAGENATTLSLTGEEVFNITGLQDGAARTVDVTATCPNGQVQSFKAQVLLMTPKEVDYFRHGGILHYVLRQLAATLPVTMPVKAT